MNIKKKYVALTVGILLQPMFCQIGSAANPPINGPYEIDQDMEIEVSRNTSSGISVSGAGGEVTIQSGQNPIIEIRKSAETVSSVRGIEANNSGVVDLRGAQKVTILGADRSGLYTSNDGKIYIGDYLTIKNQTDGGAQSIIAVEAAGGLISIGDFANLSAARDTVLASLGAEVSIGKNAQLTGGSYSAVLAHGIVTIGEGAVIDSPQRFGAYVTGGGRLTLKDNVTITSRSTAIWVGVAGGRATIGKNATLSSNDHHAIEVQSGGVVEVDEGATLTSETNDAITAYTGGDVHLKSAVIRSPLNALYIGAFPANTSRISGRGRYHITGNLSSNGNGLIDLEMTEGSYLKGKSSLGEYYVLGVIGKTYLNMDRSRWDMTETSVVTDLINQQSIVDMTQDENAFSTLTTENLSGDGGSFILDIDGTAVNQSDRIYVTNTFTGTQSLDLRELNGRENDNTLGREALGTVLASVYDNQGTFTAQDGEGTLYYQRYTLDQRASETAGYTTDWYLDRMEFVEPEERPTTSVEGIFSSGSSAYHMWRDSDQLMKRMGDLRHQGDSEKGLWFRMKGSKIGRNDSFRFRNNYQHYELGYDKVIAKNDRYTRYGGISFSYLDGKSDYQKGKGNTHAGALSVYGTQVGSKGHYLDLIFRAYRMNNDFYAHDDRRERISGDYSNTSASISAEYGRKIDLNKKGWYIEPQVQITLGNFGSANYTTSNGVRVRQEGIDSALGRVGFNLGKDVSGKTNIYLKMNVLHEFGGRSQVSMRDQSGNHLRLTQDFQDTWLEYGLGIARKMGKESHFYFDVERSAGSDYKKSWQWNTGARWAFR